MKFYVVADKGCAFKLDTVLLTTTNGYLNIGEKFEGAGQEIFYEFGIEMLKEILISYNHYPMVYECEGGKGGERFRHGFMPVRAIPKEEIIDIFNNSLTDDIITCNEYCQYNRLSKEKILNILNEKLVNVK